MKAANPPTSARSDGGVDVLTTRLDEAVNWARKNSLWPMPMGISCCAIEMMAAAASRFDIARFGSEVLRFSPRQADLMIVAGTLTYKMAPVVRRVYDQMPEPKWVIAMGACLITGGMFDSYPVVQGLDHVVPVDVYVPGCPPRPEGLIQAILQVQKMIQESGRVNSVSRGATHEPDVSLPSVPTDEKPTCQKTMMLNMGPQHPATHGVLRLVLEVRGEEVVKAYPHIGYLHRGYEKLGENRTYHQFITYTDRLDYLSALSNNVAYAMAVEKLLGIEVPGRSGFLRVICCELARLSSHFLSIGTYAVDVGATSVFFYTFSQREVIYDLAERLTGSRMTTSYTRIGGLARDVPAGWIEDLRASLRGMEKAIDETEALLDRNAIFLGRTRGVGVLPAERALSCGLTGPNLRACGVALDLRADHPYLVYDEMDFDVVVGSAGDAYDRYKVRMAEMRESIRILRQASERIPDGPVSAEVPGVVLPARRDVREKMEEMIYHFKIIGDGFRPPPGEVYSSIEAPKGELGFFIVSDGGPRAARMRIKSPSMANIRVLQEIIPGHKIADVSALIASVDPVMGECDR